MESVKIPLTALVSAWVRWEDELVKATVSLWSFEDSNQETDSSRRKGIQYSRKPVVQQGVIALQMWGFSSQLRRLIHFICQSCIETRKHRVSFPWEVWFHLRNPHLHFQACVSESQILFWMEWSTTSYFVMERVNWFFAAKLLRTEDSVPAFISVC